MSYIPSSYRISPPPNSMSPATRPCGYRNEGFVNDDAGCSRESATLASSSSLPNCGCHYNGQASHTTVQMGHVQHDKPVEGRISAQREAQHFCETTTMHGPKRIFKGKRWAALFWFIMVSCSLGLLITQVVILSSQYLSKPTVSDVSFIINEGGMDFPLVTVCNLTPIRKSYINAMNSTNDVTPEMINYLMRWYTEINTLIGNADRQSLHQGNVTLQQYLLKHPNFTTHGFFMDAGFECSDVMKHCTFQGEVFDCCSLATAVMTPLGRCFTIDLSRSAKPRMHKQTEPGILAGLALILDAHLEEQFDGVNNTMNALFTNSFLNGYRYFVHPPNTVPHLASDEFTVSPNSVSYSAISGDRFVLLPSNQWGNCTDSYPDGIQAELPYSSGNCLSLCKAKYFMEHCGCTPALYNIENNLQECTPYDTYTCIDTRLSEHNKATGKLEFQAPNCGHCAPQCSNLVFRAYNSYGSRFSAGALNWLNSKNPDWTVGHMKANFQMINIFYRDMSYTEYNQVQDASITQLLSDIGGNMGMFLGMSVITITEICLFFSKVFWLGFSKKRRDYMYSKRINEKTHERDVCETVEKMKAIASQGTICSVKRASENSSRLETVKNPSDQQDSDSGCCREYESDIGNSRSGSQKY